MLYEGVSARPTTIPLAEVRESVSGQPMSAAGHSLHKRDVRTTSAFHLIPTRSQRRRHVAKCQDRKMEASTNDVRPIPTAGRLGLAKR
jgi:hypothetical protein